MISADRNITKTWLTLKVITFPIHEDVVDKDDAEDAGPKMNITEHQHKANILYQKKVISVKKNISSEKTKKLLLT